MSGDGMQVRTIDEGLAVGAQVAPEDLAALAARGFRAVICARPDDEDPGQPSFAAVAEAARALGMEAAHVPVAGRPGAAQAEAFAAAMARLPGPVYAYCRSGGRAAALAQMTGR